MSMITGDTVLAFQHAASVRSVGDGVVILLADSGQLYTGNGTTGTILQSVDGYQRISDLAAALSNEFDISAETATEDIIEIAGQLIDEGVLRVVE